MSRSTADPRTRRRAFGLALLATVLATLAGLFLGCGDDDPAGLGGDLRTPPDTLRVLEIRDVAVDTVFHIPVVLGRSPVAQLGHQLAYSAHVLLAYDIPTRVVDGTDTLRLDTAQLVVKIDSLGAAPFTGSMRLRLREVAGSARDWSPDSLRAVLPPLQEPPLAPDTVLAGSALANRPVTLTFDVDLQSVDGFDGARAAGTPLAVNVALQFVDFPAPGEGFLEFPFRTASGTHAAQLLGFENGVTNAIATVDPVRQMPVVTFGSYDPGTKLVASDGHPLHSWLRFAPLRDHLPDSALVHVAELVLTPVEPAAGTHFGAAQQLGIVVPANRDSLFTRNTNRRALAFSTVFAGITPGAPITPVVIAVTPYVFDLQEGTVEDNGMILRLSNEGTKVRHFEFHGGQAPLDVRPRLRIVYSVPARFEGGGG
jgi:hypothetical protein